MFNAWRRLVDKYFLLIIREKAEKKLRVRKSFCLIGDIRVQSSTFPVGLNIEENETETEPWSEALTVNIEMLNVHVADSTIISMFQPKKEGGM